MISQALQCGPEVPSAGRQGSWHSHCWGLGSGGMGSHRVPLVPFAGAPPEHLQPQDVPSLLGPCYPGCSGAPCGNLETT